MKKFIEINLALSILKQGGRFVAYSPALDLSTSGTSQREVKRRFTEAAFLLMEELDKAGTVHDVLTELGWTREQKQWAPPQIISQGTVDFRMPVAA